MIFFAITFLVLSAILLGTLTFSNAAAQRFTNETGLLASSVQVPPPSSCKIQGEGLPDPSLGATNPLVTQNNIHSTICVPGWAKPHIEPPVSYTGPLKTKLMRSYGLSGSRANYELDHLVPLKLEAMGIVYKIFGLNHITYNLVLT